MWQQLGMELDSIDIVSMLVTAHGRLGDEDGLWILLFPNPGQMVLMKESMGTMDLEALHFSEEWSVRVAGVPDSKHTRGVGVAVNEEFTEFLPLPSIQG